MLSHGEWFARHLQRPHSAKAGWLHPLKPPAPERVPAGLPGPIAVAARNDERPDARFRAASGARFVRLGRAVDAGLVRLSA